MSACNSKQCGCPTAETETKSFVQKTSVTIRYRIDNMDCASEERLIRDKLGSLSGVTDLEFNLIQHLLTVHHQGLPLKLIEQALADIGMQAVRVTEESATRMTVLRIIQMDCPTEESLIRSKLTDMAGVKALSFNLMQRSLQIEHQPDALPRVLAALKSVGMDAEITDAIRATNKSVGFNWWPLITSGLAASMAEGVHWFQGDHWGVMVLALIAILTGGLSTYKKGWIALKNRNLNMNALMSIAVTGAMLIGHWPEAAMVMVLFTLAEVIEAKSLDRARNAIRSLLDLTPQTVMAQQTDGNWVETYAQNIHIGSRILVKPGEHIALDGKIVQGHTTVNQAPITGESLPVDKSEGDSVFAGTINQSGSFEYLVTAIATESTLARIIHAVETAQGSRAPTQRFVDQFARLYTPMVLVLALAVALLPPLLLAEAWSTWAYTALVLLVIACPCALVISTPISIVSGLTAAARHGILIKGGAYLEAGRNLKWIALDKTGTLTQGKPVQTDFELFSDTDIDCCRYLAASLAAHSDHPVSQAISVAAVQDGITRESRVSAFKALPGLGVHGIVNGKTYWLGNHRWVHELGLCSQELEARIDKLERQGKTVVMLLDDQQVMALFAVADKIKDSSRAAVTELHQLGIKTLILTGDNPHTAEAIARHAGIDLAFGNQLPEDKLKVIENLSTKGSVGMVGDGINDAPALARANIGFAMGAMGTDTAIETADVALMDDDLRKLPTFVRLSQATHSILIQNITLALGIKAVFLVLSVTGQTAMWMAVFADMGASLLVIGNGLRLLRR